MVDYIFPRLYVGNQNKKKTKKKEDETSSCDSRHRQSRDKDDSTSQESSDSDKENKTKKVTPCEVPAIKCPTHSPTHIQCQKNITNQLHARQRVEEGTTHS